MATSPFTLSDVQKAFPRFLVKSEIRPGGQGAVYDATRNTRPDGTSVTEHVALKIYFDRSQTDRVTREIQALDGYDHPNLARLVEHGNAKLNGQTIDFIAWEFVDGIAVDMLLASGRMTPRVVAVIGRDVSRAIDHVWKKRIVHRDVKPNNIILRTGEAESVLIDLGVARYLTQTTLTGPGMVWGTPGYYSPEQSRGETALTCNSDIFSLGVVLQQCLCRHHPTNNNQLTLITAPPQTAQLAPTCPVGLAELIDRMLSLRAAFRPSPADLSTAFADLVTRL